MAIPFSVYRKSLSESTVYSKKIKGIPVKVVKKGSKFDAYVDGEKLDSYSSQKEADGMIAAFIKQL